MILLFSMLLLGCSGEAAAPEERASLHVERDPSGAIVEVSLSKGGFALVTVVGILGCLAVASIFQSRK